MNIRFLIDALTQQTTILIAQLSTTGGVRAPLANIANQVFLELSRELNDLAVTRKVAADMFGMALRSYHAKIRRLEESSTEPAHRSLWELAYDHLLENGPLTQQDMLTRFRFDSSELVRGVLFDLVESGLVYQTGAKGHRMYQCVPDSEIQKLVASQEAASLYWAIWMYIYRNGPLTQDVLLTDLKIHEDDVERTLSVLMEEGRVERDDAGLLVSSEIYIPMGEPAGWEAALFDHFSAMTTAMVTKLREMRLKTLPGDEVGGSTYTFDVWEGHPMREEVRSQLRTLRGELSALNERLRAYNEAHAPASTTEAVTLYLGQSILLHEAEGALEEPPE